MLLFSVGCLDPAAERVGASRRPIVNGQDITGWEAVVALTADAAGPGFGGSMCTGTLLSSEWVLTAAHCIAEFEQMGAPIEAMKIYVGYDAAPDDVGSLPTVGELFQVAEAVSHPDFDFQSQSSTADIALIRLAERAEGKATLALNSQSMQGWSYAAPLYIGFGASDVQATTGAGIKRATNLTITSVQATTYSSSGNQTSICKGDSGGPALLIVDSVDSVVGVNSVLIGDQNTPCTGQSTQTRVDPYVPWLQQVMAETRATCDTDADLCLCAAACQNDGFCDNSVCRELSCAGVDQCVVACAEDAACAQRCYDRATLEGRRQMNALLLCNHENCEELEGDEWKTCVDTSCSAEIETCFPRVTGSGTCLEIHYCMSTCGDNASCQQTCFEKGTEAAQGLFDTLARCIGEKCGEIASLTEWNTCVEQTCVTEANSCGLHQGCTVGGSECPQGTVCYPLNGGVTGCYPSAGAAENAPCDPQQAEPAPCGEGLFCWDETSTCRSFCTSAAGCADGETCEPVFFPGHDGLGVCAPAGSPVTPGTDGGTPPVGGDAGGGSNNPPIFDHGDQGGCTVGGRGARDVPAALLFLLALIGWRRRR